MNITRRSGRVLPIDLHVHSCHSDGTCTPARLVAIAQQKGLGAFALTDHDSASGIEEAVRAAENTGIEVIPGAEMSTQYRNTDIHIVGLFLPYQDPEFQRQIREFSDERIARNEKMCRLLTEGGYPVTLSVLQKENPGSVITRAHIGRYLFEHGYVSSVSEAFERLIGSGCPYFVPRAKISPEKAIRFIHSFGGLAILAHPFQYIPDLGEKGVLQLLDQLTSACALDGIEAYYTGYSHGDIEKITGWAVQRGLLISGGSDFHGDNKPGIEMGTGKGSLYVPGRLLYGMKRRMHHLEDDAQILFLDFDGTLATSDKTILPETMDMLRRWDEKGNVLCLSTGRNIRDGLNLLERLQLPSHRLYLSAYNGGSLYDCRAGKVIYNRELTAETVREISRMAAEEGVYLQTYDSDSTILCTKEGKELEYYTRYVKLPYRVTDSLADAMHGNTGKCLAISLERSEGIFRLKRRLETEMKGTIASFFSNAYYLEIVPAGVDKGYSLQYLSSMLGIARENTAAAGDAQNDIPMLCAAGAGIAMCNGLPATPGLAEAASIITPYDNDHNGLVPVIRVLMQS